MQHFRHLPVSVKTKFCDLVPADVHYISKTVFIDIGIIFPIMSAIDSSSASVPVIVLVSESPQAKRQYGHGYLDPETKYKTKVLSTMLLAHGMPTREEEWLAFETQFPMNVAFLGKSFTETLSQHDCFKDLHARLLELGDSKISPIASRLRVLVDMLAIADDKAAISQAMTAESTATVEKKENRASQVSKELAEAKAKIAQLEALISAKDVSKADTSILVEVATLLSAVADKGKKRKGSTKEQNEPQTAQGVTADSEDDIPLRKSVKAANKAAKMQAALEMQTALETQAAPVTDKQARKPKKNGKGK